MKYHKIKQSPFKMLLPYLQAPYWIKGTLLLASFVQPYIDLHHPPFLSTPPQKQDSATLDMERANKEIDMLRKQCEAISQELKEGLQEAEVAKCRRDWAFQERDKIVAERESIR